MNQQRNRPDFVAGAVKAAQSNIRRTGGVAVIHSNGLLLLIIQLANIDIIVFGNFQDKTKTILTAEKKLVQVTGTALFPGDIAPKLPSLCGGTLTVFGQERRIEQGCKNRNPDGTVNYCSLEVV